MEKELIEKYKTIENQFFELDHENKKALIKLKYDRPSDIFASNALTKTPILDPEFFDFIKSSFELIPNKYKVDFDVKFADMEGYSEEQLSDIFKSNVLLEAKRSSRDTRSKNKIALSLLVIGIVFLIGLILLETLWGADTPIYKIITFIIEIGAWVTTWEALGIMIIRNKEKRTLKYNLLRRFNSITFGKK